ncbi:MAG: hypothetical protein WAL42_04375 [Nitrososphaeraceae archaeon]
MEATTTPKMPIRIPGGIRNTPISLTILKYIVLVRLGQTGWLFGKTSLYV